MFPTQAITTLLAFVRGEPGVTWIDAANASLDILRYILGQFSPEQARAALAYVKSDGNLETELDNLLKNHELVASGKVGAVPIPWDLIFQLILRFLGK